MTIRAQIRNDDLGDRLQRAGELLADGLGEDSGLVARLAQLRERLAEGRLQLAVLGQFKRGKSTFVNALLGAPVLPSAVVPLTAAATFISWDEHAHVRISFEGGKPAENCKTDDPAALCAFLHRYVAEEANPENRLGVAKAELFYPAEILADGTRLIDTPGVGSTLKHNTDAALRVIPECDAALFVIATDPPITDVELDYLDQLKGRISRIFIVVNKIDTLAPEDREVLITFLRKVLEEKGLLSEKDTLFEVSARQGLAAKQASDDSALKASGIATLETDLLRYLATEKTQALQKAIGIKFDDVLGQAESEIALRTKALAMPLQMLESKIADFDTALHGIEEQRRTTADLMLGDKRRLVEGLEDRIATLRETAHSEVAAAVDKVLQGDDPGAWQAAAQKQISIHLERIFTEARQIFASLCAKDADALIAAYQTRIDGLVGDVRRTAAALFEIDFRQDLTPETYAMGEEPYWITEDVVGTLIPDPGNLIDRLVPAGMRRQRLRERLLRNADQLIVRNAENLRWALLRGFDETFRNASSKIEERLDDAIAATRSVTHKAVADRQDKSFAAGPETERLKTILTALAALSPTVAPKAPATADADGAKAPKSKSG